LINSQHKIESLIARLTNLLSILSTQLQISVTVQLQALYATPVQIASKHVMRGLFACAKLGTGGMECSVWTLMNVLLVYTAAMEKQSAVTLWAVTPVHVKMVILVMVSNAKILMSVKRIMVAAMSMRFAPTEMEEGTAVVGLVLVEMDFCALMLMSAKDQESATGTPLVQTTLDPTCAHAILATKAMEIISA